MVEASVFIGAVIIAVTQVIKYLSPAVKGLVTIAVAVVVGIVVALVDTSVGIRDITVAQGILTALAAIGVHSTVNK